MKTSKSYSENSKTTTSTAISTSSTSKLPSKIKHSFSSASSTNGTASHNSIFSSTDDPTEQDDSYYMDRMRELLIVNTLSRPPSDMTELADGLFMGNQKHADDHDLLRRYRITHVINCAGYSKLAISSFSHSFNNDNTANYRSQKSSASRNVATQQNYYFQPSNSNNTNNCSNQQNQQSCIQTNIYPADVGVSDCLILGASDNEDYDISKHFARAIEFLHESEKEGGRALVHCNLGVNRSGAIVAAYLMNRYKMTLLRTIGYLKRKRTVVLSNRGFRKQLIAFARANGLLEKVIINVDSAKQVNSTNAIFNQSKINEERLFNQYVLGGKMDEKVSDGFNKNIRFGSVKEYTIENVSNDTLTANRNRLSSFKNKVQSAISPPDKFWSLPRTFARHVKSKFEPKTVQKAADDNKTKPDNNNHPILKNIKMNHASLAPVYEHFDECDDVDAKGNHSNPCTSTLQNDGAQLTNQHTSAFCIKDKTTNLNRSLSNRGRKLLNKIYSPSECSLTSQTKITSQFQDRDTHKGIFSAFQNYKRPQFFQKRWTSYNNISTIPPSPSTVSLVECFEASVTTSTMRPLKISASVESNIQLTGERKSVNDNEIDENYDNWGTFNRSRSYT